ncbi:class I SAM-dependent methyltransferase [Nocardiopsis sp. EMB25]|uniref:class I SAM-dependent methyltransferase n=1 Tax=Nocardiopsis sp. EMB25 TaxID=2835867 RepID=UPI0022838839|nr:class I SAM-dependent methyltransferase [Nocardiopsis sp. EMB25]MCY9784403.1 class I SAM-dependent methyltransferase [Nocardiopsis sp. EMB25]
MTFTVEEPARDADEVRRRHEANRIAWDEGALHYTRELAADIERLRAGESSTHPVERAALGDLASWCGRAVHLQCASGQDTLSLLLEGAREVVGVDISGRHVDNARAKARALALPATFHRCDVLDTPSELDGTADLVYTGQGALCWIHDIRAWAGVVARLLRPGGRVLVFDTHPATCLLDPEATTPVWSGLDYFAHAERNTGWPAEYIGDVVEEHAVKHERLWTIADVVQALIDQGLALTRLEERPDDFWNAFPALGDEAKRALPMTFLLTAERR